MPFTFSFSGADIDISDTTPPSPPPAIPIPIPTPTPTPASTPQNGTESETLTRPRSAFPIAGQALLAATSHSLSTLLSTLPSKISYSSLRVKLDNGEEVSIPRRELWDVRMQLMAEDEGDGNPGSVGLLGDRDVKTGVYEGGFKSWESSVDLVRVLASRHRHSHSHSHSLPGKIIELGCGTALPSLALLQWYFQRPTPQTQTQTQTQNGALHLSLADYNPSVLSLVTLPNLLLTWAQTTLTQTELETETGWGEEGELEITPALISQFRHSLEKHNVTLSFFSGAWSPEFVDLVAQVMVGEREGEGFMVIGAETIYSPFALKSFAETVMALLGVGGGGHGVGGVENEGVVEKDRAKRASRMTDEDKREKIAPALALALVGAKKVYFGVGGSISDFCEMVRQKGGIVSEVREETEGVRRVVVEVRGGRGAEGLAVDKG